MFRRGDAKFLFGIAEITEQNGGAQSFTAVHLRRLHPVQEQGKPAKQGEGKTDTVGCT